MPKSLVMVAIALGAFMIVVGPALQRIHATVTKVSAVLDGKGGG